MAPLERKNGWTSAEEAGHAGPDRIHRPLNRIEWDADEVLDDVCEYVAERLGDPDAVLIMDNTGFLKKGTGSSGVQRQHSGTAGRTENLPASWTEDRERCRPARVDDAVGFATEVAMAKTMVRRAIADEIPFRRVTADAGHGHSKGWRSELEQADVFHVMATTRHDTVVTRWAIDHPVSDLFPGSRWAIEECFRTAKQECGLDDYQVRRYPGWHRHITLAAAAHACLTVPRARELDTGKAETDPPSSSTSAPPRPDA